MLTVTCLKLINDGYTFRNEKVLQEVKEQELMLNEKSEEFEQLALVLHRYALLVDVAKWECLY